jgi:formate dehydrogenase subunit gamma
MEKKFIIKIKDGKKLFFRFSINQRIQHIILASSVIVCVLTGMPLKFPDLNWAKSIYAIFGGIVLAPIFHRIAGTVLLILFAYHIGYLTYYFYHAEIVPLKKSGPLRLGDLMMRLIKHPIVPNKKDLDDIITYVKYLFFLTDKKPKGAEFTWKEKFDYWAPFWGIVIMGLSGIILWAQEWATKILPGVVINFALIAHSDEALLAALFLSVWHWYNVHFSTSVFPMGTVFLTGYLSEELMVEEHYEYYVEVMKREGFENEILPPHVEEDLTADEHYQQYVEAMKRKGLDKQILPPIGEIDSCIPEMQKETV